MKPGIIDSPQRLRRIIEAVDRNLDTNVADAYRQQPLARTWARVTKVCEEAGEVWRALSKLTGENFRKGVCGTQDELTAELADTACAALFAIQHLTKDPDRTLAILSAGLLKAESRLPHEEIDSETQERSMR